MSGVTEDVDETISAIASFFIPGLGHALINGQTKRGVIVFAIAVVAYIILGVLGFVLAIVTFFLAGIGGFLPFLLAPLIHIGSAYDAYSQAKKIQAGEVIPE